MIHHAWIAIGGNQGDILQNFQSARKQLDSHLQCTVKKSSLLYQTPPLGPQNQPDYLNAVIYIQTKLHPQELLTYLQSIEHAHGRVRQQHWGQRTLDLDILAFNKLCLNTVTLTLPHPEMHKRQFVLKPLCDIDSNWHHPHMNQTAKVLLQQLIHAGEADLPLGVQW